jgi:hypothetical protein
MTSVEETGLPPIETHRLHTSRVGAQLPLEEQLRANRERQFGSYSWANIEDHSQIVRFVSNFIADGFVGISRTLEFMGLVLAAYAVLGQQKSRISCGYRILKRVNDYKTRTQAGGQAARCSAAQTVFAKDGGDHGFFDALSRSQPPSAGSPRRVKNPSRCPTGPLFTDAEWLCAHPGPALRSSFGSSLRP